MWYQLICPRLLPRQICWFKLDYLFFFSVKNLSRDITYRIFYSRFAMPNRIQDYFSHFQKPCTSNMFIFSHSVWTYESDQRRFASKFGILTSVCPAGRLTSNFRTDVQNRQMDEWMVLQTAPYSFIRIMAGGMYIYFSLRRFGRSVCLILFYISANIRRVIIKWR